MAIRARNISGDYDRQTLRSEDSSTSLLVQFLNRTARLVDVIWVDYGGHWIRYKTVHPGDNFETLTFVTHPWVFQDNISGTRLVVVDRGNVFIPRVNDVNIAINPEGHVHFIPTLVPITLPVFSLRDRCMETVERCLKNKDDATSLEIPEKLIKDIRARIEHHDNQLILPVGSEHVDF